MLQDQTQCLKLKWSNQLALSRKNQSTCDPWEPTKEEQDIHETSGHAQSRAWCSSCLAGAGRDTAHVRVERSHEHAIPVLAADYCFMGERDDGDANPRCIPILVMQFDVGTWMHSHAVPNKGTRHPWGTRKLADAMVQSGFPEIISKTDNEPAVVEVKRAAIRLSREEQ